MKTNTKNAITAVIIFIVILSIPLTILLLRRQQEIRSRASTQLVAFSLSPATQTIQASSSINVDIFLDGGSYNISAIDYKLLFDTDVLEIVSFQPSNTFNSELTNQISNTAGNFHYAAVNFSQTKVITGNAIPIGTLTLKGKPGGTVARSGTVRFDQVKANASGQPAPLSIGDNVNGTYTVTQTPNTTPTDTPVPSLAPTATTIPTEMPTPTPIATPTLTPNGARLSLTLSIKGLGEGIGNNSDPKTKQRQATVCLYATDADANGDGKCEKAIKKADGFVNFNKDTKKFDQAVFDLGVVPEADYQIFVKTDTRLRKRIPGIKHIAPMQTTPVNEVTLISGDITNNNILDIEDWNAYVGCFGDKIDNTDTCKFKNAVDLNDDGKTDTSLDFSDYKILLQNFQTREGD